MNRPIGPRFRAVDVGDITAEPLPLLCFGDWQGRPVPKREWIVDGWVPAGHVTALYGDGGTGKSLLAQQLMTAAAIGQRWIGLGVERCRSLGLFCEDDDSEILRRQAAINTSYGVEMRDLTDMVTIARRVGEDNTLMVFDRDGRGTVTQLWHQIRRTAVDHGARLLVVDTAADAFGGNELVRTEVRQFLCQALGALARDIKGGVLLCAHPSVRGVAERSGVSGSTAWNNTVRSRLYLDRPRPEDGAAPDPNARVLTRVKANHAAVGEDIRLRWECGVLASTHRTGGLIGPFETGNRERAADQAFLKCLDTALAQGRSASATPNASTYAPKMFCQMDQRSGFGRREFERAMERLLGAKAIHVASYVKPNRHPAQRIERTAGEASS